MTSTVLSPVLVQRFCDNNGNPLFGGQLFSYQAGTTTPQATYTDSTGNTPNTNPVVLNARGEANVWIPPNTAYKFVLEDSAGNQIWTVDQVMAGGLVTLYGGVDTGAANAYVINYTANFSSLANGIVIYWIPSNNNTGSSTLNVNSLGAVNIVNPGGTSLIANQIIANYPAQVMYYNGTWILMSAAQPVKGSFTATLSNAANTTGTLNYLITQGGQALVWANADITSGASTASTIQIAGAPSILVPSADRWVPCTRVLNNGVSLVGSAHILSSGGFLMAISLPSTVTVTGGAGTNVQDGSLAGSTFSSSGTNGLKAGWSVVYPL